MRCPCGKYRGRSKQLLLNDINCCQWILNTLPSDSLLYMYLTEKSPRKIVLNCIGHSNTPYTKQEEIEISESEPDGLKTERISISIIL